MTKPTEGKFVAGPYTFEVITWPHNSDCVELYIAHKRYEESVEWDLTAAEARHFAKLLIEAADATEIKG